MLDTKSAGVLVGPGVPGEKAMQKPNIKVEVTRPFYYMGALQPKGKELDLPHLFATEMIWGNKAIRATAAPAQQTLSVPKKEH